MSETTVPLGNRPTLSGYTFIRDLGMGGMGAVYLYRDEKLSRSVAVKVVHPTLVGETESRARFLREARSLAKVDHDNIIRVYNFMEIEQISCFVMEYVEGPTLAQILKGGPGGAAFAIDMVRQTSNGLEAALERGVIHRDIKPANLLIDAKKRVRIADLGLAKAVSQSGDDPTLSGGKVYGTPAYMSPEQARGGQVDHLTDIYSLGIVFFETIIGRRPEPGRVIETLAAHHSGPSEPLIRLVASMTSESPRHRPASYQDLRAQLEALPEFRTSGNYDMLTIRAATAFATDDPEDSLARKLLRVVGSTDRWWEIDQILSVFVMFPLWLLLGWIVDQADPAQLGTAVFFAIGLCQAITTTLRAFLLLISGTAGEERTSQVERVTPWIRGVDLALMAIVGAAGFLLVIGKVHRVFGILLAALSIAGMVKFVLLDPFLLVKAKAQWLLRPAGRSGGKNPTRPEGGKRLP